MRLASQVTGKDPRDQESAEIIDLASRTAYPAVAQQRPGSDALGLAAGVAIVAGLGAVAFWAMTSAELEEQPALSADPTPVAVVPQEVQAPEPVQAVPPPIVVPEPIDESGAAVAIAPRTNPYSSPTVVFDSSAGRNAAEAVAPEAAVATSSASPASTGNSAADFASRIGGLGGAPAQATSMTNPSTTVTQGTLIPAILETAIDTDVPGFVRAVVSEDVRSFDGKRILVPRSSRLVGQYQSGLQGGQKRAFVIWTRLIRPDGASVNLASPAVGFDGTTGLEGDVNSNFFGRFGSALLLSVVDGLAAVASGGASVVLGGGSSAAAAAIEQDGKIGPTIRVRQGEPIRVFTSRDLDFSQVPN
ncbi:MAG: type VI secretion protein [Proteobacteria bacterium]|nr:type VI secretion protein [Pseudomonadota bacterium]MDA0914971.1 type VI secretion protein [Pseudomonadota bacterium]